MAQKQPPKSDIPKLSAPANRALEAAGYTQLKQLTKTTEADLMKLHGMGPKAMGMLKEAMQAKGLAFKEAGKGKN